MADDNKKIDVTRGEFNGLMARMSEVEKWADNRRPAVEKNAHPPVDWDDEFKTIYKRLDAVEKHPSLSIPPLAEKTIILSIPPLETKTATEILDGRHQKLRAKGEAVLRSGTVVMFRPADGLGPKEGYAAIVCASRIIREGFAALYTLWVLVPRKAHWEENVREGTRPGEFEVS
jgi:hypothetical protein